MSAKRRELKDFVFDDSEPPSNSQQPTATVALSAITLPAQQPRRYFDPLKMEHLIQSVKAHGILENLLIRPIQGQPGQYELVAGERRYRAAQAVGLVEVPVTIRELTDSEAITTALVENLQREDLNPVEETEGILQLVALRLESTQDEVTALLYRMINDISRMTNNVISQPEAESIKAIFTELGLMGWESFVSNRLPLLKLPTDILEALRSGQIAYTKARALARLQDEDTRKQLLEDAIAYNLSLSEIKRKIKEIEQQPKSAETPSIKDLADETFRRLKKSQVWDDPKKKAKVEKLLAQLNALIEDDKPIA
ncbi:MULTISPECIES: ParB/RepB/Spo0J family partition protein [Fischerella]|uniref:Chromosome partitioning protein ParB n=1 Tax=Fischerella muscicola CCMEE 5323 TaxID=2019572 RepID=A0A2N6JZY6_FISMU|nr:MULTISPECIES: ParB/RepB/Spo0J family partition protein [Fischerella]MBD2431983.1 ParB/RepB/Spo0J family partition protein [Fischerella sp. FACHB-380]PLZ87092.1 chromosome partitioning protein ParB [Fischerella muscicola CCMEE 5323]